VLEASALLRPPADHAAPTPRQRHQLLEALDGSVGKPVSRRARVERVAVAKRRIGRVAVSSAALEECDGVADGITVSRVGSDWATDPIPLAREDIGVIELEGCFPSGTTFEWQVGDDALALGADARANLVTGEAGDLTLQGCAVPESGEPSCFSTELELPEARARVELDSVTTLADYGYGKLYRLQGAVAHAPAGRRVWIFKHSDVHYYDSTSVSIGSDGSFSVNVFAMNNVDRFVVTLVDASLVLASQPGCNASWCFGRVDAETGHNVPIAADRSHVLDFEVHYFLPSTGAADPQIDALRGALAGSSVSGTLQPAALVRTDWESKRYFLYDQALAALAFTYAGDQTSAERVLNALANLQLANGSWYFMYNANGTSPFPAGGDYRYTGAVAWAVMAFNAYHHAYSGLRYQSTVDRALVYLDGLRATVGDTSALRFNPTNLASTSWNETLVFAFEHNADAYSAFRGHAENTSSTTYASTIDALHTFLAERWNGSYFNPGVDLAWGENTLDVYLDPMTWGVLALGTDAAPYYGGLDFACDSFLDPAGYLGTFSNVLGFFDYRRADEATPVDRFGWMEGSFGMVTALQQVERDGGVSPSCRGYDAATLFDSLARLEGFHGRGTLPEATLNDDPDYDSAPSAAATAWFYFAKHELNPFRPWEN